MAACVVFYSAALHRRWETWLSIQSSLGDKARGRFLSDMFELCDSVDDWELLLWSSLDVCVKQIQGLVISGGVHAAAVIAQRLRGVAYAASIPVVVRNREALGDERWSALVFQLQVKTLLTAIYLRLCARGADADEKQSLVGLTELIERVRGPTDSWTSEEDRVLIETWEKGLGTFKETVGTEEDEVASFGSVVPERLIADVQRLLYAC